MLDLGELKRLHKEATDGEWIACSEGHIEKWSKDSPSRYEHRIASKLTFPDCHLMAVLRNNCEEIINMLEEKGQ